MERLIPLHWWYVPLALAAAGAVLLLKPHRGWNDLLTGLFGLFFIAGAILVCIGVWMGAA